MIEGGEPKRLCRLYNISYVKSWNLASWSVVQNQLTSVLRPTPSRVSRFTASLAGAKCTRVSMRTPQHSVLGNLPTGRRRRVSACSRGRPCSRRPAWRNRCWTARCRVRPGDLRSRGESRAFEAGCGARPHEPCRARRLPEVRGRIMGAGGQDRQPQTRLKRRATGLRHPGPWLARPAPVRRVRSAAARPRQGVCPRCPEGPLGR